MQTPQQDGATPPVTGSSTGRSLGGGSVRGAGTRTATTEVLASFHDYGAAQRLVDQLSDAGFPVETTAIIGSDIRLVEDVTGRKRYGRAALEGAGSGAMTGFLIGALLSLFAVFETVMGWLGMLVSWTIIGAVVGIALGLIMHALQQGRRDFSSNSRIVPGRFDVVVEAGHAADARRRVDIDPIRVEHRPDERPVAGTDERPVAGRDERTIR